MKMKAGRGRPKKAASEFESRNEQILEAARLMFATRGYADTDVEELASTLGIGKGTIYRAFPSKQELFVATLNCALEQMTAYVRNEVAANNVQGIRRIQTGVQSFLRFFDKNPELIELFIQERAAFPGQSHSSFWEHCRRNSARWEAFFADLMEQGHLRKMDPHWVADTLNQVLYGQLFLHRSDGSQESLESRSKAILTIFFVGILTPEAQHKLSDSDVAPGDIYNE